MHSLMDYNRHTYVNVFLKDGTSDLASVTAKPRALKSAQKNADSYNNPSANLNAIHDSKSTTDDEELPNANALVKRRNKKDCYFCGNKLHHRDKCPAKDCLLR